MGPIGCARVALGCRNVLSQRAAIVIVIDGVLFRIPRDGLGHDDLLREKMGHCAEATANGLANAMFAFGIKLPDSDQRCGWKIVSRTSATAGM